MQGLESAIVCIGKFEIVGRRVCDVIWCFGLNFVLYLIACDVLEEKKKKYPIST